MRPVLVDVTRTVSRALQPNPTGIDRVERAYIDHFQSRGNAHFVAKIGRKFVLLDRDGMREVIRRIDSGDWGPMQSVWSDLGGRRAQRWIANRTIRRLGVVEFGISGAEYELLRRIGQDCVYLNVGHTNLDDDWLVALRNLKVVPMLHDMIPLDSPQFQTPKSVETFEKRAKSVAAHASLVLANSNFTAERIHYWFSQWGQQADIQTVHLGVDARLNTDWHPTQPPYFVMLGTIEPRKNHRLILDTWRLMSDENRPDLHIIGKRGWMNTEVFEFLDTSPLMGTNIFEHGALSDKEMLKLLAGASALLFPSHAEGFGLPVLEALQIGVPVVAKRLPVLEELAGNSLLYMDSQDANVWSTIITRLAKSSGTGHKAEELSDLALPSWGDHFEQVERLIS